jgi:hypothetical protein
LGLTLISYLRVSAIGKSSRHMFAIRQFFVECAVAMADQGGGVRGVVVTGWSLIGMLMADEHDSR